MATLAPIHPAPSIPAPPLGELTAALAELSRVSADSYQLVLGQAIDTTLALLDAHALRSVPNASA